MWLIRLHNRVSKVRTNSVSGEFDDTELNNLGPGGVSDQNEAELRRQLNRDLGGTLDNLNFQSRRSSIMAQIRQEASPGVTANATSPLNGTRSETTKAGDNLRSFTSARRRGFNLRWASGLAAVFAILLVGALILLTLSGSQNSTRPNSNAAVATTTRAVFAAATTVTTAAATATEAATTTTAAAAATTTRVAAAVAASSFATPSAAVGGSGSSAGGAVTTAATATTTAAATTAAATTAAATTAAASGSSQEQNTALPNAIAPTNHLAPALVGSLPVYPGATPVTLTQQTVQKFLLANLNPASTSNSSTLMNSLKNNLLTLLRTYKVNAANLPAWYTKELESRNFKLSTQNNGEASINLTNYSIKWLTFSQNSDPNVLLTYVFVKVKNGAAANADLGIDAFNTGDTLILVLS